MNWKITDADLDRLTSHMELHGDRTERVLDGRIGQPLPGHVIQIRIDRLDADPKQPRRHFREETLRSLADSIRDRGVLQALVVRPGEAGRHFIVAGERRFRAARLAGLESVPCTVQHYTETEALLIGLVENIHRDDLTDMEKSDALARLKDLTGNTWEEIGQLVRLTSVRVQQLASLQALAPEVQEQVRSGSLAGRKALVIRALEPSDQIVLARDATVNNLTLEEIRSRVQERTGRSRRRGSGAEPTPTEQAPTEQAQAELTATEQPDYKTRFIVGESPDFPSTLPSTPLAVPGVINHLNESLNHALTLLRSTGGIRIDPESRQLILDKMDEVRRLLLKD